MNKTRIVRINKYFIIIVVFIFACLIFKLLFVGTHHVYVNGNKLRIHFVDDSYNDATDNYLIAKD